LEHDWVDENNKKTNNHSPSFFVKPGSLPSRLCSRKNIESYECNYPVYPVKYTYTVRFLPPGVEHEQAFREVVFFLNKRLDVVLGQERRVPEISKIEKSVSIDHTRNCIQT